MINILSKNLLFSTYILSDLHGQTLQIHCLIFLLNPVKEIVCFTLSRKTDCKKLQKMRDLEFYRAFTGSQ